MLIDLYRFGRLDVKWSTLSAHYQRKIEAILAVVLPRMNDDQAELVFQALKQMGVDDGTMSSPEDEV